MKITLDMQGVQTESRHRGIGRYCLAITQALFELARGRHDIDLLFNAALDGADEAIDTLDCVRNAIPWRSVGPIRHTASHNRHNAARREAAERVFSLALESRDPDVVWLGSVVEGFADDALVPHTRPQAFMVATLYDLIPLHDPDYLGHSSSRDWYLRRIDALKRCDLLLAISSWVRDDAIERLGIEPERIVAIGAGVNPLFRPPEGAENQLEYLRDRFGIDRRFVMYNGGFDKRKNVSALLEAYAALPALLRMQHVLVVVGRVDPIVAGRFAEIMATHGLDANEVIFTGFVSDDDLVKLYQSCALFVFPSEREGFGLAPLEAMACGAATIANDATSLPEVMGDSEALFDVTCPGELTARIAAILTDPALAARLRRHGLERARHFGWDAVASRAMTAIEKAIHSPGKREMQGPTLVDALPHYRADSATVTDVLPKLRCWPGSVEWLGPLPSEGPSLCADRYRLHGYAGLGRPAQAGEWIDLLRADATSVIVSTDAANSPTSTSQSAGKAWQRQRATEDAIARSIGAELTDDDIARVADALDRVRLRRQRRWLVDVTAIAARDLGTGVHRVVRSILREWLREPPVGTRVEPVVFQDGRFHHAHEYACRLLDVTPADPLPGDIVGVTGEELFIGLDWAMESVPSAAPLLRTWRRAGVRMHFVIHDLLPILLPQAFHPQSRQAFSAWIEAVSGFADALHCVSRSTAGDVRAWLGQRPAQRHIAVDHFTLGVERVAVKPSGELDSALASAFARSPTFLMVGTLEPRKGHAQALEAMNLLWAAHADVNLLIVGHRGWLVNELVERIERHEENGRRLFWLDDADDATLEAAYAASVALLVPSQGEGYGLPIIEAAHRGKPVIARGLPVFREIAGDYPSYFDTESPEGLASFLARWLVARPPPGRAPSLCSWAESAASLAKAVETSGRIHVPTL
ncbi:glycosyltransferase family 1 protein [Luteibacter sp. PPL552]